MISKKHYIAFLVAYIAAYSLPITAVSQTQATASESYDLAYFKAYTPITALDIIENIPAFSITEVTENDRGFTSGAGNVIVNGELIGSKSNSITQYLEAIPASRVKRVEIIDAVNLGLPGLTGKVANIITHENEFDGTWRYGVSFDKGLKPQLANAEITLSGKRGNVEYIASLGNNNRIARQEGDEFYQNQDGIYQTHIEDVINFNSTPKASLSLTLHSTDDVSSQIYGSIQAINNNHRNIETFEAQTSAGQTGNSLTSVGTDTDLIELSLQHKRPILSGDLTARYLYNDNNRDKYSEFKQETTDNSNTRFQEWVDETLREHIVKLDYNFPANHGVNWGLAGEAAFNDLDNETIVHFNDDLFSEDNITVSEDRYDVRLTRHQNLNEKTALETAIGAEVSTIKTAGRAQTNNRYFRPKGKIQLTHQKSPKLKYRAAITREVEQLDFRLFVEDNNFSDQILQGGGTNIVPPQYWQGEIGLDANPKKNFSWSATASYRRIEDPIDRIIFDNDRAGPGNLDKADLISLGLSSTYKIANGPLKELKADIRGSLKFSSIDDPIINDTRTINDNIYWLYRFNIEHPIAGSDISWGLTLTHFDQDPFFLPDRILKARFNVPSTEFRVAHNDIFGKKLELKLENLLNTKVRLDQRLFDGDRGQNQLELRRFERKRNVKASLIISDKF